MARNQAERERKEQEHAIAAGMLQVKGSGKKKRRAAEKGPRDRGLMEDGGAFHNGILRVRGAPAKGTSRVSSFKRIRS